MLDTSVGDDNLMNLPPMHVDSLSSIALFNCVYLGFHAAKHYMLLQRVEVDGLTIHVVATCCSMEQLHWNDRLTHDLLTYLVNVYHIQTAYSAIHTQDNKFVKFD